VASTAGVGISLEPTATATQGNATNPSKTNALNRAFDGTGFGINGAGQQTTETG
jgi:hypothetical protein